MTNYVASQDRNIAVAARARKRRARLLTLVDEEFTVADAIEAWDLKRDAAKAQVRMMVLRHEIEDTSAYRTPRTYRKINEGVST